ncbi:MAG: MoxR family ATPase, partial [Spirochaetia bacterium]|nr:MoxR family ATPase [Spirochaetia bacterium]
LIDEIDKADAEFPNDLLLELDQMEFVISETGRRVQSVHRPLAIITSNNEKELPDAFLRRCIFHYIDFPDPDFMKVIVRTHYPEIGSKLLEDALRLFYDLRTVNDLKKKPSTSELIDWIRILVSQGAALPEDRIPYAGALIKNEEDMRLLQGRV